MGFTSLLHPMGFGVEILSCVIRELNAEEKRSMTFLSRNGLPIWTHKKSPLLLFWEDLWPRDYSSSCCRKQCQEHTFLECSHWTLQDVILLGNKTRLCLPILPCTSSTEMRNMLLNIVCKSIEHDSLMLLLKQPTSPRQGQTKLPDGPVPTHCLACGGRTWTAWRKKPYLWEGPYDPNCLLSGSTAY